MMRMKFFYMVWALILAIKWSKRMTSILFIVSGQINKQPQRLASIPLLKKKTSPHTRVEGI